MSASRRAVTLDALVFLLVPALVFATVGIGFISGDAIAQAGLIEGGWHANPNHLLLEPFGAAWVGIARWVGVRAQSPDVLAWLSVCAGCISLVMFRTLVAPAMTTHRSLANAGTVALALLSGFDRLWVSGEAHMIQMPFLVLHVAGVLALVRGDERQRRAMIWAVVGGMGAVLAFISNALLVTGVVVAMMCLAGSVPRRRLLLSLLGAGLLAALVFTAAWAIGASGGSLLSWLGSYAGGRASAQAVAGYGVRWSFTAISQAGARAVFGLLSSIVDLAPVSDLLRRHIGSVGIAVLHGAACLLALGLVGAVAYRVKSGGDAFTATARTAFIGVLGAGLPVLVFGAYWNNSDDQFYFQISPMLAALAAAGLSLAARPRLALILAAVPLAVNARDLAINYLGYPRAERLERLSRALEGAALVIAPGRDEVGQLLFYAPTIRPRTLYVASLAETLKPDVGLRVLRDTVTAVLARGGQVAAVNLGTSSAALQPWPLLRSMGYELGEVARAVGDRHVVRRTTVTPTMTVEVLSGGN